MNTGTPERPVRKGIQNLHGIIYKIRIRQLLLLIFGLLSLIAIAAISWNAVGVYQQYIHAENMAGSNVVGEQSLALNVYLARERGLTAALLANRGIYDDRNRQHLNHLRQKSDESLRLLFQKISQFPRLPTISLVHKHVTAVQQRLEQIRLQADHSLDKEGVKFDYTVWIKAITGCIEEVATANRIVSTPVDKIDHAVLYGTTVKEAFFNLSENAGRERALISAVIAQHRPFNAEEYDLLRIYKHTRDVIGKQMDDMLGFFPDTAEILAAQENLQHTYKKNYQALLSAVMQSSRNGLAYPVTAREWFDRSTEAVDAIINLSGAIDSHINDDIELIKSHSRNTVTALFFTVLLVMMIFTIAFAITFQRIIMPLRELEWSANTIARGDFSVPVQIFSKDEFADVAKAFEVMRDYLLNDRERRQKAEDQLRKLSTAIEQSTSSIIITDIHGVTEYVNPQFYQTTGYTPEEVIGHKFNLRGTDKKILPSHDDLFRTIRNGHVWQGELLNKKKNGDLRWDLVSVSPVRNREGKIAHFICIQHDITERKALEKRLDYMAYHDELTGLPNRTLLIDRFEQHCVTAKRLNEKVFLLMLDLDRFKLINDSLGHRIGDRLLVEVANRLKQTARGSDTVARYGGDEFVILASGFSDKDMPIDLSKRLLSAIEQTLAIESYQLHVSASIGITLWPDDGDDMDTLLRQADTAMYHAKSLGRGQFQFFTRELNQQVTQRLRLENDLRDAIENQEFEIYYQPQVSLKSGKIVGAEALIRWNHPELGLVSPDQFIATAEDTNLIIPIGEWVIRSALKQAIEWKKLGHTTLSMAVNVSTRQLDDASFISQLISSLETFGLEAEYLEIEITESSVMSQPEKMLYVLNSIKSLGIKLALDDFGTGYSSLSYLRRFPFDKLKIDRSFIKDIASKPEDAAIIRTIGEIAHNLNMTVTGEGVETDIQATYMRHCGCDEIQGYLISRPIPAAQFELLLRQSATYLPRIADESEPSSTLHAELDS